MAKSDAVFGPASWFETRSADAVLALAVTVLGQVELRASTASTAETLAAALFMLAQTAPIALRRTSPLLAVAINVGALALEALTVGPGNTLAGLISGLVLTYSAGRWCGAGQRLTASVLIVAGLTVHVARMPDLAAGDAFFVYLFTAAAWLVGVVLRRRSMESEQLTRERDDVIAARLELEQRVVAEERARIARELHDVVAHGLTLMVVQAGAAQEIVVQRPHEAVEALSNIRETGRDSLVEMRRLLGLLRDSSEINTTVGAPGLGSVSDLVDLSASSGQQVSLEISGPPTALPPGLDVSAYRIIQEALTNARRHGGGGAAEVRISYLPDQVDIDVTNDVEATPDEGAERVGTRSSVDFTDHADSGFGLIGIRERVALFGGTLDVGPTPSGTFRIHVGLPVARAMST